MFVSFSTILFISSMMNVDNVLCYHYHFCVFDSIYQYSLMKDDQPTLYVSLPQFLLNFNLHIQISKRLNKYPTFDGIFPLVKHRFTNELFSGYISNNYVKSFIISQKIIVTRVNMENIVDIICQLFQYYIQKQHDKSF